MNVREIYLKFKNISIGDWAACILPLLPQNYRPTIINQQNISLYICSHIQISAPYRKKYLLVRWYFRKDYRAYRTQSSLTGHFERKSEAVQFLRAPKTEGDPKGDRGLDA